MDKPISVGDLVAVVRGMRCCGAQTGAEGMFFTVDGMKTVNDEICSTCQVPLPGAVALGCPGRKGIDLDRLKRIPPIEELDDVKRTEELESLV